MPLSTLLLLATALECFWLGSGCLLNCSLAGDCVNGSCVCDVGWGGVACQQLQFAPAQSVGNGFHAPAGSTTWGGTPIQSDDRKSYYMYVSLSRNSTVTRFSQTSVIVTTKSDRPAGPYTMLDAEAGPYTLGPRSLKYFDGVWTQNPVVVRLRDRAGFALFYAGGNDTNAHWSIGHASIGVAFSKSLEGPWVRPDHPVLEPLSPPAWEAGGIANPAVYVRPDNSILLAYRGKNDDGIAFASAPSWRGPYKRLYGGQRLFVNMDLEDPFLLESRHGLHMLMHSIRADNCSNCWTSASQALSNGTCTNTMPGCTVSGMVGVHAFAPWASCLKNTSCRDPIIGSWTLAPMSGLAAGGYSLAAVYDNSVSQTFSHREEPKLLFEWSEDAEDYIPTHLFNVVIDGLVRHWKYDESYVHAQPLLLAPKANHSELAVVQSHSSGGARQFFI